MGTLTEYPNVYKVWMRDGMPHREDGPAVTAHNGYKEWWICGERHGWILWKMMTLSKTLRRLAVWYYNNGANYD